MLEGDILPPLSSSGYMLENAQRLPSQYSDSAISNDIECNMQPNSGFLDRLEAEFSANGDTEASVILIEDNDMETIVTNDSTNDETSVAVDLSKGTASHTAIEDSAQEERNENLETLFDRDFAASQNKNNDLILSLLDDDVAFDFDLSKNVSDNIEDIANKQEKPSTSKAARQAELKSVPLKFFTQLKQQQTKEKEKRDHIAASWPKLRVADQNSINSKLTFECNNMAKTLNEVNDEDEEILSFSKSTIDTENDVILDMSKNAENFNESFSDIISIQSEEQQEEQQVQNEAIADEPTSTTSEENEHQHSNLFQKNTPHYASDASETPQSIKKLFDLMKTRYSDLTFVYALSAQLCQDRVPMACYVNVKMGLLLSIASCAKNPTIPPIPIIVMGHDTYMANFLMMNIADMADRFVGPCDDVKSTPSGDGYRNCNWIEADPIQLATGGVYYVGDWSCLSSARSEKIFKDIETGIVAVERATRIYPLETAIWAHWRAFKYNAKDQQLFNKFVKVFGIPICMDNRNQETLVDFLLKQASTEIFESTVDHLSVSADDMRKFLATISQRTVDASEEATNLLRKYFVASRNERPDCLTKQAYPILKQLAESFAKLSLRHEVLVIDAVGAILLCEDFLQHLYGPGMDPPPMLDEGNFVGDIDKHVARFHEWLKDYIGKYCDKET